MKRPFGCVLISVLWLLWFGLLPGTFAVALITGQGGWSRFWWISSLALSASAWVNWVFHRRDRLGPACALVALGMTSGMLADLYGAVGVLRFTEPLTMVIPLFALGHVAYIAGMLMLARRLHLTRRAGWSKTLASAVAICNLAGLTLWAALVHPSGNLPSMHLPTAGYVVFLSTAAALMATVAWLDRSFLPVGIGGLFFLASDGFLAVRLFQDNWQGIGNLCWITYGVGQMLIVYGLIAGAWSHADSEREPAFFSI
ncbi:MAG: lysoplasmalogenase family protein [Phycisphaerales bacterium]